MRGWGGKSPKRTTLWSNSTGIRYFATSSKYSRMKSRTSKSKLADVYYDKAGKKRYKGNRRLKKSQCETYSPLFHQNDFELFSYVHDGPYTHGFSAIILDPHAKGIPEWIWKAICRFNEKPHQRKRISSLPISGAFVGCFIVVFFRGWPFTERTTPNIIAKSLVYYCNFPVGLPPQEKAPTSLPPIAFFLGFCLLCLWVVGAFFGGANPTGKLLVYNLWGVRLVGCCPCMFIIPARARGSRPWLSEAGGFAPNDCHPGPVAWCQNGWGAAVFVRQPELISSWWL